MALAAGEFATMLAIATGRPSDRRALLLDVLVSPAARSVTVEKTGAFKVV
jgi:hypothetical protein